MAIFLKMTNLSHDKSSECFKQKQNNRSDPFTHSFRGVSSLSNWDNRWEKMILIKKLLAIGAPTFPPCSLEECLQFQPKKMI